MWQVLAASEVLSELTTSERLGLQKLLGTAEPPASAIVERVIAEVRDYIRSGGYAIDESADNTLPLGLHSDAIAIARWRYLISIPAAKTLQTDARKEAVEHALEKLAKVAAQEFAVEPPGGIVGNRYGSWNSENKILGRMHPVTPPQRQKPTQEGDYARGND